MKKLLHLKQWLTVVDAARYLGILFGEEVTEADVLRLALDGHLTLSVNFVNHAYGRCGPVVPIEDAKRRVIEIPKGMSRVGDLADDKTTAVFLHSIDGLAIDENRVIEYDLQPVVLNGIWDLTMAGAERLDVEHRYQQLTGGPAVTLVFLDGPILCRDDGIYCQVMQHFSENEFADPKTLKNPYNHPGNFFPGRRRPCCENVFAACFTSAGFRAGPKARKAHRTPRAKHLACHCGGSLRVS